MLAESPLTRSGGFVLAEYFDKIRGLYASRVLCQDQGLYASRVL